MQMTRFQLDLHPPATVRRLDLVLSMGMAFLDRQKASTALDR